MRTSDVGSTPTRGATRSPRHATRPGVEQVTEPVQNAARPTAVIVLAAGNGTRMKSKLMKVLHPLCGRTMIGHVLCAAQGVDPRWLVTVVGNDREQVAAHVHAQVPEALIAVQQTQEGTGHAV